MKVKVTYEKFDHGDFMSIKIDDKQVFSIGDGCSEDMTMSRDLNDCYHIPDLLKRAYEAGKRGEEFNIETVHEEEQYNF